MNKDLESNKKSFIMEGIGKSVFYEFYKTDVSELLNEIIHKIEENDMFEKLFLVYFKYNNRVNINYVFRFENEIRANVIIFKYNKDNKIINLELNTKIFTIEEFNKQIELQDLLFGFDIINHYIGFKSMNYINYDFNFITYLNEETINDYIWNHENLESNFRERINQIKISDRIYESNSAESPLKTKTYSCLNEFLKELTEIVKTVKENIK